MINLLTIIVSRWHPIIKNFKVLIRKILKIVLLEGSNISASNEFENIVNLILSFDILNKLLCVASNLRMRPIGNHLCNRFPILAIDLEPWGYEELPSMKTSCSWAVHRPVTEEEGSSFSSTWSTRESRSLGFIIFRVKLIWFACPGWVIDWDSSVERFVQYSP